MADTALTISKPDCEPVSQPVDGWYDLLAKLKAAQATADKYDAEVFDPLHRAFQAFYPQWPAIEGDELREAKEWMRNSRFDEAGERMDELNDVTGDIETELMERPAPDGKAALWKFRRLYTGDNVGTAWNPDYIKQANIDIERFLSAA